MPTDKVTETFTGKEKDDETELSNHGARMLDPMLGLWIAVDPERFFSSPYLYMGNGYNPIRFVDLKGEKPGDKFDTPDEAAYDCLKYYHNKSSTENVEYFAFVWNLENGKYATNTKMFKGDVDRFGVEQIYEAATTFKPMGAIKPVFAGAHLHGGLDNRFDSEQFSNFDYEGFSSPDAFNLDLYLMTPEESFQKLNSKRDVEIYLPEVEIK